MDLDDEKEKYRLWVAYLKRSDDYRALWDVLCKDKDKYEYEDWKNEVRIFRLMTKFSRVRRLFGDIFQTAFDEIWENRLKPALENRLPVYPGRDILERQGCIIINPQVPPPFPDFWDYIERVEDDIDDEIRFFRGRNQRDPTPVELKALLKDRLAWQADNGVYYIGVDVFGASVDELTAFFRRFLKSKKHKHKDRRPAFPRYKLEKLTYIRIDELKKYLRVYDLSKKRDKSYTLRQIIEEVGDPAQRENSSAAEVQRTFRRYIQKARRIIENAERGEFPGKY